MRHGFVSSYGNEDVLAITCGEKRSTLISEIKCVKKKKGLYGLTFGKL